LREHEFEPAPRGRSGKRRFDDDDPQFLKRARHQTPVAFDTNTDTDAPPAAGDAWSSWDDALHGPQPRPDWVVTELAAIDVELGILKTGKEADVFLVRRGIPDTDRTCLLAAKRYREPEHRMFHRDAGYLEGRRVRRSREMRAMTNRTAFGRDLLSGQWAAAEFAALATAWSDGVAVPYPVQLHGTELLLEFIGDADGTAAPRLAQLRPDVDELCDLWHQLGEALLGLARRGLTHGDLSAYNLLVHDGRLVLIDIPQVVSVVGNPQGPRFLERDVHRITEWFSARGLPADLGRPEELLDDLQVAVGMPPGPATSHG